MIPTTDGLKEALQILSSTNENANSKVENLSISLSLHNDWKISTTLEIQQLSLPRPAPIASNIGTKRRRQQNQQQHQHVQQQKFQNDLHQKKTIQSYSPTIQPQLLQPNTNTVASTLASIITTSQVIDSSPIIILPQSISTLDIARQLILEFERNLPKELL